MAYQTIALHEEGGALRITLDRPEVLNALTFELLGELAHALRGPAAESGVRAVLITGAGRGFCAGADLASTPLSGDIGEILETSYHPVVHAIAELNKPVIAGVNGVAAGAGLSLALACDMRFLAQSASFAVGFTGIGLVMDAGGSYFLPRLVGVGRAMELALSNRRVGAEEALALGLGERILEGDFAQQVWVETLKLAQGPTLAYGLLKRELRASLSNGLSEQLALEARSQARAATSADVREGITAFMEKRGPEFKGE
ncbi:MAG: enoyl-CoA hydratase-related protein [Trueperaceae bacterium]|jgi:2-(1,2-epoxy-1,2-dihydrophenyl)acetyl-CoA isomerase